MGHTKKDIPVFNVGDYGGCDKNKVVCPITGEEVWVFAYHNHQSSYYQHKTPDELAGEGCRWHHDPGADRNCPYTVCGYEEDGQRYRRCKIPQEEFQETLF